MDKYAPVPLKAKYAKKPARSVVGSCFTPSVSSSGAAVARGVGVGRRARGRRGRCKILSSPPADYVIDNKGADVQRPLHHRTALRYFLLIL